MADPKRGWIVNLQGKDYATWPYVLDEAHKRGLVGTSVELVQIPCEENGHVAIVKATARFGVTPEAFEAYGDASPRNVNSKIASALIRMAETRAKGRALRDACNIGMTLKEELPDNEPEERPRYVARTQPGDPEVIPYQCQTCGADVPGEELGTSRYRFKGVYCVNCRAKMDANAAEAPPACEWKGCGQVVTPAQAKGTKTQFGQSICRDHVKDAASAKIASKPLS